MGKRLVKLILHTFYPAVAYRFPCVFQYLWDFKKAQFLHTFDPASVDQKTQLSPMKNKFYSSKILPGRLAFFSFSFGRLSLAIAGGWPGGQGRATLKPFWIYFSVGYCLNALALDSPSIR